MKIAGGLALIGAVVAEFVAGSGTATGLAWRIVEAGNRLEIATMFAALALLALLGVAIFAALSALEYCCCGAGMKAPSTANPDAIQAVGE